MLFQTRKTFIHFQNSNENIFDVIRELSDPAQTAMQLKCSQTQKCSKDIRGSTVILQSYENTFSARKIQKLWLYSTILLLQITSSTIMDIMQRFSACNACAWCCWSRSRMHCLLFTCRGKHTHGWFAGEKWLNKVILMMSLLWLWAWEHFSCCPCRVRNVLEFVYFF